MSEMLDVVIVGGGLVGGLTALLLAQGGVQATVLDAAPVLDQEKTLAVMNPRVLALSQATIHLLKTVDVWNDLARQMPYSGMQVWNKNGYGEINFGHVSEQQPQSDQALGSMVEPSVLNVAIQQKMLQLLYYYFLHQKLFPRLLLLLFQYQLQIHVCKFPANQIRNFRPLLKTLRTHSEKN